MLKQWVTFVLLAGLALAPFGIAVAIGAKIGLGQYQVSPLSWPQGLAALLPVLVGTWFTAISEELVFRGYLVKILAHRSPVVIAVVTSLGFVALHLPHWGSPVPYWTSLFFKGLFYAIPVLISRSLWFGVGHHWAWNYGYFLVFGGVPAWHAQEVAGYPLSADYVYLGVSVLMALSAPFVPRLLRVNQNPRRVSAI